MASPLRRRRTHSPAFKAMLVAKCREPGASVAAVVMAHQINDNLLRAWVRKAATAEPTRTSPTIPDASRLVPVQLAAPAVETEAPIRIHIQHGNTQIHVEWPVASASLCREWLQGWLR